MKKRDDINDKFSGSRMNLLSHVKNFNFPVKKNEKLETDSNCESTNSEVQSDSSLHSSVGDFPSIYSKADLHKHEWNEYMNTKDENEQPQQIAIPKPTPLVASKGKKYNMSFMTNISTITERKKYSYSNFTLKFYNKDIQKKYTKEFFTFSTLNRIFIFGSIAIFAFSVPIIIRLYETIKYWFNLKAILQLFFYIVGVGVNVFIIFLSSNEWMRNKHLKVLRYLMLGILGYGAIALVTSIELCEKDAGETLLYKNMGFHVILCFITGFQFYFYVFHCLFICLVLIIPYFMVNGFKFGYRFIYSAFLNSMYGLFMILILVYIQDRLYKNSYIRKNHKEYQLKKFKKLSLKQRSLIRNILPEEVCKRLQKMMTQNADNYTITFYEKQDDCLMLCTDFHLFTNFSRKISCCNLVDFLNLIYSKFDELTKKSRACKLCTVGDSYVLSKFLAEGCEVDDEIVNMILLGLNFIKECKVCSMLNIRIGLSRGENFLVLYGGEDRIAFTPYGTAYRNSKRLEKYSPLNSVTFCEKCYKSVEKDERFDTNIEKIVDVCKQFLGFSISYDETILSLFEKGVVCKPIKRDSIDKVDEDSEELADSPLAKSKCEKNADNHVDNGELTKQLVKKNKKRNIFKRFKNKISEDYNDFKGELKFVNLVFGGFIKWTRFKDFYVMQLNEYMKVDYILVFIYVIFQLILLILTFIYFFLEIIVIIPNLMKFIILSICCGVNFLLFCLLIMMKCKVLSDTTFKKVVSSLISIAVIVNSQIFVIIFLIIDQEITKYLSSIIFFCFFLNFSQFLLNNVLRYIFFLLIVIERVLVEYYWDGSLFDNFLHLVYLILDIIICLVVFYSREIQSMNLFLLKKSIKKNQQQISESNVINYRLIRSILPKNVAQLYLRDSKNFRYSKEVNNGCILFSEVLGISDIDMSNPKSFSLLLDFLNNLFSLEFDKFVSYHECERIKIIENIYFVVEINESEHSMRNIASLALDLKLSFDSIEIPEEFKGILSLRVGVSSGKLRCAVIGTERITYDVFGSSVNYCSRLMTTSEENKIHVDLKSYNQLKIYPNLFIFDERKEKVVLKGIGEIKSYYLSRNDVIDSDNEKNYDSSSFVYNNSILNND